MSAPTSYSGHYVPPPRVLVSGKPYEDWTEQDYSDMYQWNLGPKYRTPGLKPPPHPVYKSLAPVTGDADALSQHVASVMGTKQGRI
ncbi:Uncharacterised protein [Mycobacteroides abscessus subsp. abscessus]|uniref:hypothetical protein n=1 Tax=Mycobacteroides abscessus TaxID=36809 RepID=UPI00092ACCDF|nr:hypothetical protein [Mycobacteroides abscessus]SIE28497.1 Uncharacterised protein [Mycobacteroides abscessus subsp. abscessus]SKV14608.1 Uncharacterised protein [Mycobacteroides abscessus subsp. abscessus]